MKGRDPKTPGKRARVRRWKKRSARSSKQAEEVTVRIPVRDDNGMGEGRSPVAPGWSGGPGGGSGHFNRRTRSPLQASSDPSASVGKDRPTGAGRKARRPTKPGSKAGLGKLKKKSPSLFKRKKKKTGTDDTVDPRIAERARRIREKEERRAFKGAMWLLGVMTAVGIGVWVAHSPYLTVERVVIDGLHASSALQRIEDAGIRQGVPMITIDEDSLRQAVLSDPWVAEVEVAREWPHTVRIEIRERYPVAWALTAKGWRAVSLDAVELDVETEELLPHVSGLAGVPLELSNPGLGPALEFLDHLRADLRIGTKVEIHGSQVTAEVAGRIARLGRTTQLEEKAGVLGVLIDHHTDPGSVINLFSPFRPAVYRGVDGVIVAPSPSS